MSNEEKKALETLKEVASDDFCTIGDDISPKMAQNILNVIDKQQKEIEREKQYADFYKDLCNNQQKEIVRYKKEIEEKSTIIMAGAEKVKQLEKEIEELRKNKKAILRHCIGIKALLERCIELLEEE